MFPKIKTPSLQSREGAGGELNIRATTHPDLASRDRPSLQRIEGGCVYGKIIIPLFLSQQSSYVSENQNPLSTK